MDSDSIAKCCRLCFTEILSGISIFEEKAQQAYLYGKIKTYLSITVSSDDLLPKMICDNCFEILENFHAFANITRKNQEKMCKIINNNSNLESNNNQQKSSLLHTYLTKGVKVTDLIKESNEITEMEITVDPMVFLEYSWESNENSQTNNNNSNIKFDKDELLQINNKTENCEENVIKFDLCTMETENFPPNTVIVNHNTRKILNSNDNCQDKDYLKNNENKNEIKNFQSKLNEIDQVYESEFSDIKFSCPICKKSISTKGNLKVHLETHKPKGQYHCNSCGRIFKTQCNLRRHEEYHSGNQFSCSVCGRVYPTNSTLKAHSITHSNLRPHKCHLCDKTFKRNQDLKFHINQHTGARPYQCPYCPKAFASSGNCFSHRKRMHPLEVELDKVKAANLMR